MAMVVNDPAITKLKEIKDRSPHPGFDYVWYYKKFLLERRFQRCRILAVGALNSAMVEFMSDGAITVTNRFAVRKFIKLTALEKRKVLYAKENENLVHPML